MTANDNLFKTIVHAQVISMESLALNCSPSRKTPLGSGAKKAVFAGYHFSNLKLWVEKLMSEGCLSENLKFDNI